MSDVISLPEFKLLAQHLYPGMIEGKGVALDETLHEISPRRTRGDQPLRPRKLAVHGRLRAYVHTRLAHRWLPEQIAKQLSVVYPDDATMRVVH